MTPTRTNGSNSFLDVGGPLNRHIDGMGFRGGALVFPVYRSGGLMIHALA